MVGEMDYLMAASFGLSGAQRSILSGANGWGLM